jgi:N-methylhydantoinase B
VSSPVSAPRADPILASVLQRRVQAIAREMATVLMRSTRSPIFNEIGDLVTVVFDREGRTLAQTEFASIIAFGAAPSLRAVIDFFGADVAEGDVFIHNDVFYGGNQTATSEFTRPSSTTVSWWPGWRRRDTSPTSAG